MYRNKYYLLKAIYVYLTDEPIKRHSLNSWKNVGGTKEASADCITRSVSPQIKGLLHDNLLQYTNQLNLSRQLFVQRLLCSSDVNLHSPKLFVDWHDTSNMFQSVFETTSVLKRTDRDHCCLNAKTNQNKNKAASLKKKKRKENIRKQQNKQINKQVCTASWLQVLSKSATCLYAQHGPGFSLQMNDFRPQVNSIITLLFVCVCLFSRQCSETKSVPVRLDMNSV